MTMGRCFVLPDGSLSLRRRKVTFEIAPPDKPLATSSNLIVLGSSKSRSSIRYTVDDNSIDWFVNFNPFKCFTPIDSAKLFCLFLCCASYGKFIDSLKFDAGDGSSFDGLL